MSKKWRIPHGYFPFSAYETKKYDTFWYDTVEVETTSYIIISDICIYPIYSAERRFPTYFSKYLVGMPYNLVGQKVKNFA